MKTILAVGLVLLALAGVASSQSNTASHAVASVQPPLSRGLFAGIALSKAQKANLVSASADFAKEADKLVGPLQANRQLGAAQTAQIVSLRRDLTARIRVMLTPEQRVRFDANLSELSKRSPRVN